MNHIYRLIWNRDLFRWIVAPETAHGRARRSGSAIDGNGGSALRFPLKALAFSLMLALGSAQAVTLPQGGVVAGGSGTIGDPVGNTLTVNQSSHNLAIDWQSFGIGAGGTVAFVQPDSSAVVLNRVLGSSGSAIMGNLKANGQVFIVNPNGILFGKSAQVDVGGLVASTLDLSVDDFLAGRRSFSGSGGSVRNQGALNAADGGTIALLGGQVSNEGIVVAKLGSVALAAGNRVTLDFAGDSLLNVSVDRGALDALVENKAAALIQADGGRVLLTAKATDALLQTVINQEGVIRAQTIANQNGTIRLMGDMAGGTVKVAGTLDASANLPPLQGEGRGGDGSNGGFVETSGAHVEIAAGTVVTTRAADGKSGKWLIDPQDFTIAATGGDIDGTTLGSNLTNNGDVEIQSSSGGSAGNGDIKVNDAVSWSANKLTLTAARDIDINAVMTASGTAALTMNTGTANGADAGVAGGALNFGFVPGYFDVHGGSSFAGRVDFPGRSGTGFLTINGQDYTVVQSQAQLAAIGGNLAGHYALGGTVFLIDIWTTPLGPSLATQFTGVFEGLGHRVDTYYILAPSSDYVGLFGINAGTLENVQFLGTGYIAGQNVVGALAGANNTGGIIRNAVIMFSGSGISGSGQYVGGLVGDNEGTIVNCHVVVDPTYGVWTINGAGLVGGLAGYNGGAVYNSSASGFSMASYGSGPVTNFGGLVGENDGAIANSYASGMVRPSNASMVGGLVGVMYLGDSSIVNSYATGTVGSGDGTDSVVGGLVGHMSPGTSVTNSYAAATVVGGSAIGGLVGQRDNSYAIVTNSFWNTGIGPGSSDGGTGKSSAEMMQATTFAGWDMASAGGSNAVWRIYEGQASPLLRGFLTPLTATANSGSRAYDGTIASALGVAYSVTPNADLLGSTSVDAAGASRNVGSYTLTPGGLYSDQMGYDISYVSGTLDITPASLTVSTSNVAKTYDGGTSANGSAIITAGALFGTDSLSGASFAFANKNAGTNKTVIVSNAAISDGNAGNNYTVSYADNTTSTINKASLTVSTSDVAKTYDGGTSANGSAIVTAGTLFGTDSLSGASFAFANKNAGTNKTVIVSNAAISDGNGGNNYTVSYTDNTTSTIDKANLTVSAADVIKTYDGTTAANGTAVATGGTQLFGTDTLSGGSFAFTDRNAGSNKAVTAAGVTVNDGNGGGNYTVTYADNTTSTIDKAGLTVLTSDVAKTYDGGTSANGSAIVAAGALFGSDSLSGASFAFANKNAGTNKTVIVSNAAISDGNAGGNYTVSYADNTTSTIDKASLTVSTSDVAKTYDGGTSANGSAIVSAGTLFGADSLSGATFAFADKNAGSNKTVIVSNAAISDGNGGGNYNVSYASNTTSTITKANLTVSAADVVKVYDGTTTANGSAVATSGTQLFGTDSLSGGSFAFTDRNAGSNKAVTATGVTVNDGNGGGNYTVTYADNTASTIDKAGLTVSTSDVAKTYDGGTSANGSAIVSAGTLFGADSLSGATFAFADKNAGSNKTVIVSNAAISDGNGGGNYNVSYASNTTSTITKANLTVSAADVVKVYDGTTAANGSAVVTGGTQLFGTDSLSGGSFAFTDRNAGSNKAVTAAGVTVNDGNGGGNYTVTYADNTASTIAKAALTVTGAFTAAGKVYDGTTAAAFSSNTLALSGLIGTDAVTANWLAAFTDKNAGSGKTVTLAASTFGGADGGNYTVNLVTAPTATASIAKAALTVSTPAVAKTYDGTTSAAGTPIVTAGTLFGADSLSGGSFAFTDRNAGSNKTVTAAGVTVSDGNGGNNYAVSYADNTASVINKAALTVATSNVTKTYDGTTAANGSAVATGGTQLFGTDSLSGGSFAFTDRNAGSNKAVTAAGVTVNDGNGGGNYTVTYADNTASTIDKASLTVSTSDVAKTYDGGTSANGSAIVSAGTLFGADSLSGATFAFADKNAGSNKTVIVSNAAISDGNGGGNYNVSYASNTTSTITKANLTVSAADVVKVYDGTTTANGSAVATSGTQLFGTDSLSGGSFAFTDRNAGSNKAVTATGVTVNDGNGGGNYTVTYADNTASTIDKASLTVSTSDVAKTYDGGTSANGSAIVSAGTLFGADSLSGATFAFADKNAGSNKTVIVSNAAISDGNGGGNYNVSYASNTTSTITKANLTVSAADVVKVYDGTTAANGSAVVTGGTQLFGTDSLSGGSFAFTDRNAGSNKAVTAAGVTVNDGNGGGNYTVTYADNTASTIAKAALTVTGAFTAAGKVYDGTTAAAFSSNTLALSGLIGTDAVTANWLAAFTDKNAGSGKTVTLAASTFGGADGGNYTVNLVTAPTATASIAKAALTVSTPAVAKTYDGTTSAAGTPIVTAGTLFGADSLSGGSFAFTDRNAGSNKAVTAAGVTVSDGNGGNNYAVSYADNTASVINKAALTVATSNVTKTYDGTTAANGSAVATGGTQLFGTDSLSGGSFAFTDRNAGSNKAVTAAGVTVNDGNGGGNYTVTYADNTASTIDKASLTVSTSDVAKTYDGGTSANGSAIVSAGTLFGADSLSGATFAFADKNAGSNKTVIVSNAAISDGNGGGNYNVSYASNTTSTITKANLTVSAADVVKVYDGTTTANGSAVATSGTQLFGTDSLSGGSFAFTDRNAGSNKAVTATGVTVNDGNGGGNYTVTYADNTASTIDKASLTVSTSDVAKTYDGGTSANGSAIVSAGTLFGADSLSGATFAFADKNAGTNKTVIVSNAAISDGNGGGNYNVSYASNTTSTITKANLTVSAADVVKVYDGTTAANGSAVATSGTQLFGTDSLSGGSFAFTDRNAGSNKAVTAAGVTVNDGNGGGNYAVSYADNTTSTIAKAALTVTGAFTAAGKVYDGTTAAAFSSNTLALSGLIGTDAVTANWLAAFTDKNAGSGKTVTLAASTFGGADGGNYTVNLVTAPTATASIAKAALTVSTPAVAKTYDGTTSAAGTPIVTAGTLFGADSLSGGSFAFTDRNAGSNKTVTAAGVTVSDGNGGNNYAVSYADNTTSTIDPFVISLNGSRVYDGTTMVNASIFNLGTLVGTEMLMLNGSGTVADKDAGSSKPVTLGTLALGNGTGLASNYTLAGGWHRASILSNMPTDPRYAVALNSAKAVDSGPSGDRGPNPWNRNTTEKPDFPPRVPEGWNTDSRSMEIQDFGIHLPD